MRLVTHKTTGEVFACKCVSKHPRDDLGPITDLKVKKHVEALKNEVEVIAVMPVKLPVKTTPVIDPPVMLTLLAA